MGILYRSASRVRRPSTLRAIAARGLWLVREMGERVGVVGASRTTVAFTFAVLFAPAALSLAVVVIVCRRMWFRFLHWRYPDVEFVRSTSVRAVLDTRRHQGIITLLLQVRGTCNVEAFKRNLQEEILNRLDTNGNVLYPNLRRILGVRCGEYVWTNDPQFAVDNHVVLGSTVYRGRPVTEVNIQDYVSDLVSRPLPSGLPPWQVVLIPARERELSYYVVIRIHHLVAEGLALRQLLRTTFPDPWYSSSMEGDIPERQLQKHPSLRPPQAIRRLCHLVESEISKWWVDVCLSQDQTLKCQSDMQRSFRDCIVSTFITSVIFVKEFSNIIHSIDPQLKFHKKCIRLCLTVPPTAYNTMVKYRTTPRALAKDLIKIIKPLFSVHSLVHDPRANAKTLLLFLLKIFGSMIRVPLVCAREYKIMKKGDNIKYVIIKEAIMEAWFLSMVIISCPRLLFEECTRAGNAHMLHSSSLCGRKVVSWSEPLPMDLVRKIKAATGSTVSEVLLTACAGALREYCRQFGSSAPESIMISLPVYTERFSELTASSGNGVVTLALPTSQDDSLETLSVLRARLAQIRQNPSLYVSSVWLLENMCCFLPSLAVRLAFNSLSRLYPVMVTNIGITEPSFQLWGQEVESLIFWRPPQSNVSLSVSLMCYRDTVRLAVMADQLLSPHHSVLASSFPHQLLELATDLGVPRDRLSPRSSPRHSPNPSEATTPGGSPPPSPSLQSNRRKFIFPDLQSKTDVKREKAKAQNKYPLHEEDD